MQRQLIAITGFLLLLAPSPADAQKKSCTQIAENARNVLARNSNPNSYGTADVDRALKECLKTGYWFNVSKSGGQPARKK